MPPTPRAVVVHRRTALQELLARHGTRGQAEFFLRTRGRDITEVETRHDLQRRALAAVAAQIPLEWRRGTVERADLDRFAFGEDDVVVAVGQDGLVANVAKYLIGQPVVGLDPEPGRNPGVLVPHPVEACGDLLRSVAEGRAPVEERTMVEATTDDGQTVVALNEVYVGHPAHQTARYRIVDPDDREERQSSSGVLVGTGTGATGWCLSVWRQRRPAFELPTATESALAWFVREPWPSPVTAASVTEGLLDGRRSLRIIAETEGLAVFGDGIESDRIALSWGQQVSVSVSARRLRLVRA